MTKVKHGIVNLLVAGLWGLLMLLPILMKG